MIFRQQIQSQCDSLLLQSRNEAAFIQEGANKYAEQTLRELENRIYDINQVVELNITTTRRQFVKKCMDFFLKIQYSEFHFGTIQISVPISFNNLVVKILI